MQRITTSDEFTQSTSASENLDKSMTMKGLDCSNVRNADDEHLERHKNDISEVSHYY